MARTICYTFLVFLIQMLTTSFNSASAQDQEPYIRIAKIEIDSAQVENYREALKEHAKAAIGKESGVLALYAVYDKAHPASVTVFEIYASEEAYKSHVQTPHFLKYKSVVKDMVRSLVLTDVIPIALEAKGN